MNNLFVGGTTHLLNFSEHFAARFKTADLFTCAFLCSVPRVDVLNFFYFFISI